MISLNNVFFSYNPKSSIEVKALKNISLDIKEKDFVAIVGKTGCGKSTLIQLLNGLNFPTQGKVRVDDFVVSSCKKERSKHLNLLKKKVGVVFQFSENQLFEETIEKDVAFGPSNFKISKEESLKIAREAILEVGLDETFFNRSPFDLSGGEKRKVAIAGILALRPDYLVLDEPTVGLDPESSNNLLNLLKKLNEKGTTIIIVSHDLNLVFNYTNKVIILHDGEVAKIGDTFDVFHSDLSSFGVENPDVINLALKLKKKGLNIDVSKIVNIDDLVFQLKGAKK